MRNYKFVLVSETGYDKNHDQMLTSLLDQGYELFSVVGKDCQLWEEIMDEFSVGDGINSRFIVTTSHPDETVEEVIEFAKSFVTDHNSDVDVLHV